MAFVQYGEHVVITYMVAIGNQPTIKIHCQGCGWLQGYAGQDFDDIWLGHIGLQTAIDEDAEAEAQAEFDALPAQLLRLRTDISRLLL